MECVFVAVIKTATEDFPNYQVILTFQGFKYLYVTPAEFKRLTASNSIRAEALKENGECIYKITDIIGEIHFCFCCVITLRCCIDVNVAECGFMNNYMNVAHKKQCC